MVLCKFFLQGNCRFGENCKFEHQLNDGRQSHASIIRQQNFAPNTNTTNIDTNTLIRAVTNDMLAAEKGGQWLLSCYAPFKEKPNFPGFEEQSFEEVRWGYLEAQRNGTADQFRQQLQMALQGAAMKIRSLQNPSPDAVNTIKSIYNSAPSMAANVFGNTSNFGNQSSKTVFGQSNNFGSSNVFQQPNSSAKSIFATANQKLFAGAQQHSNSIFGNNQAGGLNSQNIFANSQPSGNNLAGSGAFAQSYTNPFGTQQQTSLPFGGQQPAATGYGPQQPFGLQQNTVPFGAQAQSNTSMFNTQQNASSTFGSQQTENMPFGGNQQFAPPFGAQPNANLPFGLQQQNAAAPFLTQQPGGAPYGSQQIPATIPTATPFGNPSSIFGSNTNSSHSLNTQSSTSVNTTIFSGAGAGNDKYEGVYSKLENLSESDIKAYQSDSFEFGKIPEKPPTIQMCF